MGIFLLRLGRCRGLVLNDGFEGIWARVDWMPVEVIGDVSCYSFAIFCRGVLVCVDFGFFFASKVLVDM